jgi:nucleotide-binding universal stress UspA family protein
MQIVDSEDRMFNHILIPTDMTAHAERAVDIAVDLSKPTGGTVTLLHVIQVIDGISFHELESFYAELESRASKRLNALVAPHADATVALRTEVAYGAPITEILRLSEERQVDLVVLASHAVNREDPSSGWGTLSYKVGVLAPCPVLLVK